MRGHRRTALYEAERELSPDVEFTGVLTLDFPAFSFRAVRNKYLLFISLPVHGFSLWQREGTETACGIHHSNDPSHEKHT